MPAMTDPMDALRSFQPALSAGVLEVHEGALDPSIIVHQDRPDGRAWRFTYARVKDGKVTALVILVTAEPIDGTLCFALGYAVPEDLRGQGFAKNLVTAALAELQHGLGRAGVKKFYVEAVVGKDNIVSQNVAAATLSDAPTEGDDAVSGKPALAYVRLFETA